MTRNITDTGGLSSGTKAGTQQPLDSSQNIQSTATNQPSQHRNQPHTAGADDMSSDPKSPKPEDG